MEGGRIAYPLDKHTHNLFKTYFVIHPKTPKSLLSATKKVRAKLEKSMPTGFPTNMSGLCGLASLMLLKELKRRSIPAKICENNNHAFIRSGSYILDATATQFGFHRAVALPARQAAQTSKIWQIKREFASASDFQQHQKQHWAKQHWSAQLQIGSKYRSAKPVQYGPQSNV